MKSKYRISIQDILEHPKSNDTCTIAMMRLPSTFNRLSIWLSHGRSSMNFATLSKNPHVNSNYLMIIVYKINFLIQSRGMTCSSLSGSTMSSLIDPMTRII